MYYSIICLTPYFEKLTLNDLNEKIRILELISFILTSSLKAIESFTLREYSHFDAQVSENLCQIRAYFIASLIKENEYQDELEVKILSKEIKKAQNNCKRLLTEYIQLKKKRPSHYTEINKPIEFREFLLKTDINVDYPQIVYVLTQCFILSRYKLVGDFDISSGINYEDLCEDLNIYSKTYARKVIHCWQRNISKFSCQFIFRLAGYQHNSQRLGLLNSLYQTDEVGRHVLPCFEVTKTILQDALLSNTIINVSVIRVFESKIDEVSFFLKPNNTKDQFILTNGPGPKNIMVFKGLVTYRNHPKEAKNEYIHRFLAQGFIHIIMANMAQHPQFSGLLLSPKKQNPYENITCSGLTISYQTYIQESERLFFQYKNFADSIGCTPTNSNLFLLTHVYCSDGFSDLTLEGSLKGITLSSEQESLIEEKET